MRTVDDLTIKIFADGADLESMAALARQDRIKGLTTNPTLMRQAGVDDYGVFAKSVLGLIGSKPISFEVFADEQEEMFRQALTIQSWGEGVYVKIPITTTNGESCDALISKLSAAGVKLNVTAVMTTQQVGTTLEALAPGVPAVVSVFAGRIADTGRDPVPIMRDCVSLLRGRPEVELLWASPRELLNIFQADEIGCHIITVTPDLLKKLSLVGKDLDEYSVETVQMFFRDAVACGYQL